MTDAVPVPEAEPAVAAAEPASIGARPRTRAPGRALVELATLFLKLGATAFGGPAAHIAMMEDEVVRRRGWLSRDEFLDLLGATNLIPGPNSTEMAIHIGHRRAGWAGLLVAGACFILPATAIVWLLAWAYMRYGELPQAAGLLYGVKPVIIAVVAQALWSLGRSAVKTPALALAGLACVVFSAAGVNELAVLFGAGFAVVLARGLARGRGSAAAFVPTLPAVGFAAVAAAQPFQVATLFLVFLKVGAVLFGSGYVLLAFLRAELVVRLGWLSEGQLLDAVAVGQVTPGPVFTTATFVGYVLGGHAGALAATAGIFLPAFFFVAASGPLVPRLRRSALASAFLDGVNVASLALMAVVAWQLGWSAVRDVPTGLLAVAGVVLLLRYRVNSSWLVAAGALAGLLLHPSSPRSASATPQAQPSFVLIVLDDLDAEAMRVMATVNGRLAQEGASFEQHFVSVPLCCPSRASILTGQYAHNHGVLSNVGRFGGVERFREQNLEPATVAVWLQRAGYRTALVGKYLNHYDAAPSPQVRPPGWDTWHAILEDRTANNNDYWMNDDGRLSKPTEYQPDRLGRLAADFIAASGDRPFFLYLAPGAPHMPADPAARHESLFEGASAPRSPAFNEQDVGDKPGWLRELPLLDDGELRRLDRFYRRRLQTLVAADEMVGRVLAALEASGRLERTFVVFTSDNGFLQGQHRFPAGKNAPYEESIRVPLIVRGPGVPAGRSLAHLVGNVDYAPTFAELAHLPIPPSVDGRSLVPLLGATPPAPTAWRRDLLVEHWETGDPVTIPDFALLRLQRQVYVEYAAGDREFYDLDADPEQLENRYAGLAADQRRRLSERLAALATCRGVTCREH